jgi:hypothetical protein
LKQSLLYSIIVSMVHLHEAGSAPTEFGEADPKAALEAVIRERVVTLANYVPGTQYFRGAAFTTDTEMTDFKEIDIFTVRSGNEPQGIRLSLSYVDAQRRDQKVVAKLSRVNGVWRPELEGVITDDELLRVTPEDLPPALRDVFGIVHATSSTDRSVDIETGHAAGLWWGLEDFLDEEGVATVYSYEYGAESKEGRVVVDAIGALPRPDGTYPPEESIDHTRCAVRVAGAFDYCRFAGWQRSTDTDKELVYRHVVSESFLTPGDISPKVTPEQLELVLEVLNGVLVEAQAKTGASADGVA